MAAFTASVSLNVDSLQGRAYNTFDTLQITNGSTVTVSTNQTASFRIINIQNGTLLIQNTSSTDPVRFLMGRGSGATVNSITPSSGLGIVQITGSWITIGTGSGNPDQVMSQPYPDFVPAVWVETSSGSGEFEPWINITTEVGESLQYFRKGLEFAYRGNQGKFFVQQCVQEPYPAYYTGSSILNADHGGGGVCLLYTSSLYFGDGNGNGNVIPQGCIVKIPNILITDVTPLNIISTTSANSAKWVYSNGGVFRADTCLFDESYADFTQAQTCEMKNCAWSEYPLISECYDLTIDNVALAPHPLRRYFTSGTWTTRDGRWGGASISPAWSYINGANINKLYIANFAPSTLTAAQPTISTLTTALLYINNTSNATFNNLRLFQLYKCKNFQHGLTLSLVNDCNFNGIEIYGADYFNIQNSSNNTFTAITASQGWTGESLGFTSTWRRGIDKTVNAPYILGKPYYFKFRSYRNWQDPTGSFPTVSQSVYFYQTGSEFVDSPEFCATPYTASIGDYWNHPDYFGVWPTSSAVSNTPSCSVVWVRRDPTHNGPAYQIFRYTQSKTAARDITTCVFTTNTNTTVNFLDAGQITASLPALVPGQTYYYVLRKYSSAGVYSESEEQKVVLRSNPTASNLCLQSNAFDTNISWSKNNVTASANTKISPNDAPIGTAATTTGDQLLFNSTTGFLTQSVNGLISGTPHIFSVYLSSLTSSISVSLSASSGTSRYDKTFIVDQRWIRAALPFTTSAATAIVGIFGSGYIPIGTKIFAGGAQVNSGSILTPFIQTAANRVLLNPACKVPAAVRVWQKGQNGSGIELQYAPDPSGQLWWELHGSPTESFVPSQDTMLANSWAIGGSQPIYLTNASNNTFTGFKQIHKNSGYGTNLLTLINASSNNKFINWDVDYNYTATNLAVINTLANDNFLHNWDLNNYRTWTAANYLINATNNAQGITIQNMRGNNSDVALSNQNLDSEMKSISFANARPANNAVIVTLTGNTSDQPAISYTAVYDTIFNEFVWNHPCGSMHLNFNASVKDQTPYTITGSLYFSNTGRLYFNETGSIEYEWPWRVYGVSGFRRSHRTDAAAYDMVQPFCNSVDLGDDTTTAFCLLKEISVKTGSFYSPYTRLTGSNDTLLSWSFDPSTGFNMKVRLTAQPSLKFDGQITNFTSSEYITGSISTAIAKVIDIEDRGATGTIVLSEITGTFVDNDELSSSLAGRALVNATGSVNYPRALLPVPTSYIDALQWYTFVNTSSLYPISNPTLTLTGLISGSQITLIRESDLYTIDNQDVSTDTYEYQYDYFQDTPIRIIVQNLGYVYQSINYTLTNEDTTVPVQQQIDRNYYNPN